MTEVVVLLPRDMSVEVVAKTFAVYLMGVRALRNGSVRMGDQYAPYYVEESSKWQLDLGNNYWLRENDDGSLRLVSRYDGRPFAILKAAAELFRVKYLPA